MNETMFLATVPYIIGLLTLAGLFYLLIEKGDSMGLETAAFGLGILYIIVEIFVL